VRNYLNGLTKIFTTTLACNHARVDLTGCDIGRSLKVAIEEALIVADIEIGLGAIIGDEDFTMLERVHCAWIDIEIRVELLHCYADSTSY
jgi:hypothetical protein